MISLFKITRSYCWRTILFLILSMMFLITPLYATTPAGVSGTGLALWLDASDTSFLFSDTTCSTAITGTTGDEVKCWADKSGNNNHVSHVNGDIPIYNSGVSIFNNQPIVDFTSNGYLQRAVTQYQSDTTLFMVLSSDSTSPERLDAFFASSQGGPTRSFQIYYEPGFFNLASDTGSSYVSGIFGAFEPQQSKLYGLRISDKAELFSEGKLVDTNTNITGQAYFDRYKINRNRGDTNSHDSKIAEVILFNRKLTDCEVAQVNDYLGTKYGRDFSGGFAATYDVSKATKTDIASIGFRSNGTCSTLNQKENSANSAELTVSVDDANNMASEDYVAFAHNNAANNSFISESLGSAGNANRLERFWRIQETGSDALGGQPLTLTFDLSNMGLNNLTTQPFALLIDDDGDFSNAQVVRNTSSDYTLDTTNKTITFNALAFGTDTTRDLGASIDIYVTLATVSSFAVGTPAGVSGDLALWLDASDQGSLFTDKTCSTAISGTTGNQVKCWADKSGNNNHVKYATGDIPIYNSGVNTFNNKAVIDFTSNGYLKKDVTEYQSDITLFMVLSSDDASPVLPSNTGASAFFSTHKVRLGTLNGTMQVTYRSDSIPPRFEAGVTSGSNYITAPFSSFEPFKSKLYTVRIADKLETFSEGQKVTERAISQVKFTSYRINRNRADNLSHNSKIAEVILYNRALSDCEIQDVNKYLGDKYGRDFSGGFEATYDVGQTVKTDIASIGKFGIGCAGHEKQIDSDSSAELSISVDSGDNSVENNYVAFAHNNEAGNSFTSESLGAAGNANRLERFWRIQETGSDALGNKPLTLTFDLSNMGLNNLSSQPFALLVDDDGDFSNAQVVRNTSSDYTLDTTNNTITFNALAFGTDTTRDLGAASDVYVTLATVSSFEVGVPAGINGTDLVLWLDASDQGSIFSDTSCSTAITGSTGNVVRCWADKSGNNNSVTDISNTQPVYHSNASMFSG